MKLKGNRILALVLSLMLVVAVLAGCGGTEQPAAATTAAATAAAPAPADTAAAASTAGPAPADNTVYKFVWSHHNSAESYLHTYGHLRLAKALEEKSNGRIKIEMYPAETLGKAADQYDMMLNGMSDITWGPVSWYPSRFPLAEVTALPMLGFEDATHSTKVLWDLWENTDYIKSQFTDAHMLLMHDEQPQGYMTKDPINKMEDMKGMKIRAPGGLLLAFSEALGASVVAMPLGQVYQAVEKGVVSGAATVTEAFDMTSLYEVTKYYLDAKTCAGAFFLVMNKSKWESLPADIQQIFKEECGAKGAQLFADAFDQTKAKSIENYKAKGVTCSELTPEEKARWDEVAKGVTDKWIADMTKKGYDAQGLVTKTRELIEKYKAK